MTSEVESAEEAVATASAAEYKESIPIMEYFPQKKPVQQVQLLWGLYKSFFKQMLDGSYRITANGQNFWNELKIRERDSVRDSVSEYLEKWVLPHFFKDVQLKEWVIYPLSDYKVFEDRFNAVLNKFASINSKKRDRKDRSPEPVRQTKEIKSSYARIAADQEKKYVIKLDEILQTNNCFDFSSITGSKVILENDPKVITLPRKFDKAFPKLYRAFKTIAQKSGSGKIQLHSEELAEGAYIVSDKNFVTDKKTTAAYKGMYEVIEFMTTIKSVVYGQNLSISQKFAQLLLAEAYQRVTYNTTSKISLMLPYNESVEKRFQELVMVIVPNSATFAQILASAFRAVAYLIVLSLKAEKKIPDLTIIVRSYYPSSQKCFDRVMPTRKELRPNKLGKEILSKNPRAKLKNTQYEERVVLNKPKILTKKVILFNQEKNIITQINSRLSFFGSLYCKDTNIIDCQKRNVFFSEVRNSLFALTKRINQYYARRKTSVHTNMKAKHPRKDDAKDNSPFTVEQWREGIKDLEEGNDPLKESYKEPGIDFSIAGSHTLDVQLQNIAVQVYYAVFPELKVRVRGNFQRQNSNSDGEYMEDTQPEAGDQEQAVDQ